MSETTPPEMGAGTAFRQNGRNTHGRGSGDVVYRNEQGNCIDSFQSNLREYPKTPDKFKERIDVMNEIKNKNLFIRVSEKEKVLIERNAEKCGLSVSEYLRQRALGYMPRAALPEVFFSFSDKLDALCIACEGKISADTEAKIIALIDSITEELILPQKERLVV